MAKTSKSKKTKSKKPGGNGAHGGNGAQPGNGEQPDLTFYNAAVAEAKQYINSIQHHEMKLGELADAVESKYDEEKLVDFAKDIGGYSVADLNRWRSVYRAYKGEQIEGTSPFGVLQALQAHPARAEIIKTTPGLSVREARTMMKDHRAGQGEQEEPWRVREARRWFAAAQKRAQAIVEYGQPSFSHLDPTILRQALGETLEQTKAAFRMCSEVSKAWADAMERAPKPMFDDDAPATDEAALTD